MKILNKDDGEYSEIMHEVCLSVCRESIKTVKRTEEANIDIGSNVKELHLSIGQAVEDDLIVITKDMDRGTLIRILSKVAMSHAIEVMEANPLFKMIMVNHANNGV